MARRSLHKSCWKVAELWASAGTSLDVEPLLDRVGCLLIAYRSVCGKSQIIITMQFFIAAKIKGIIPATMILIGIVISTTAKKERILISTIP